MDAKEEEMAEDGLGLLLGALASEAEAEQAEREAALTGPFARVRRECDPGV